MAVSQELRTPNVPVQASRDRLRVLGVLALVDRSQTVPEWLQLSEADLTGGLADTHNAVVQQPGKPTETTLVVLRVCSEEE